MPVDKNGAREVDFCTFDCRGDDDLDHVGLIFKTWATLSKFLFGAGPIERVYEVRWPVAGL